MLGKVIDERYKILSRLGKGGMALVYLAEDVIAERKVAFKVLQQRMSVDKLAEERFCREFECCAKLDHPNIVKMYSMGTLEGSSHYYTMEYLHSLDLESILVKQKHLEPHRVHQIVSQIVSAFMAYHPVHLIHRDLKPGNILVCPDGRVVIVDFGLAKQTDVTALTETGTIIGTPYYMAPEIIDGKKATSAVDIYALGIMTFEMLTGSLPYEANSLAELLRNISKAKQPLPSERNEELRIWDHFVSRAMAKRLEDRYQGPQEMVVALEKIKSILDGESSEITAPIGEVTTNKIAVGPEEIEENKPTKNVFSFFVLTAIAVALLTLVTQYRPTKIVYDVKNLAIEKEPRGLDMRWKSSSPYITNVMVDEILYPTEARVLKPTKDHSLAIGPLKPGQHEVKILFPNGNSSLAKKVVIDEPSCELRDLSSESSRYEAIIFGPSGKRGKLQFLNTAFDVMGDGRKNGQDMWTIEVSKEAIEANWFLRMTYSAGHQCSFSLSKLATECCQRLAQRLGRRSGQRIVFEVNDKEDEDFIKAVKKMKEEQGVNELTVKELSLLRREIKGRVLVAEIKTSGLIEDYNRACRMAPLLFSSKLVPLSDRRSLYHSIIVPVQLRNYAHAQKCVPFELKAPPEIEDFTFGRKPTIASAHEMIIFKSPKTQPYRLGSPRANLYDRPHYELSFDFQVRSLHSVSAAEIAIDTKGFKSMFLIMTVNSNKYVLYSKPLFSDSSEGSVCFYQRIPVKDLKEGHNSLSLKAIRIFEDVSVEETIVRKIELKLAN